jgi:hypothetical protein
MFHLLTFSKLRLMPVLVQNFNILPKQSGDHQDPLHRFFSRECSIGSKLLRQVRRDLDDIVKVGQGELKQTNHLRKLMSALTKGGAPSPLLFCLTDLPKGPYPITGDNTKFTRLWQSQNGSQIWRAVLPNWTLLHHKVLAMFKSG